MSDPHNSEIEGYFEPTADEMAARNKRNIAIALSLFGFVVLVFLLMLYKAGAAG